MKSKSGFTIVELVVTISVITILASISLVAYAIIQRDARDNTRRGNANVIDQALEKYYTQNGEYPSVKGLVNNYGGNTGTAVAAILGISPNDLLMPRMPNGATNSLYSGAAPVNDYITYTAYNAVDDVHCQNGPTGGCDQFTLQYMLESGTLVTITSRHQGHPTS